MTGTADGRLRIALAQMAMTTQKRENLVSSLTSLEKASKDSADLIFYPEVQLSPFFCTVSR